MEKIWQIPWGFSPRGSAVAAKSTRSKKHPAGPAAARAGVGKAERGQLKEVFAIEQKHLAPETIGTILRGPAGKEAEQRMRAAFPVIANCVTTCAPDVGVIGGHLGLRAAIRLHLEGLKRAGAGGTGVVPYRPIVEEAGKPTDPVGASAGAGGGGAPLRHRRLLSPCRPIWQLCGNTERNGVASIRKLPAGTLAISNGEHSLTFLRSARLQADATDMRTARTTLRTRYRRKRSSGLPGSAGGAPSHRGGCRRLAGMRTDSLPRDRSRT